MDAKGLLLLAFLIGMVGAKPRHTGRRFVASLFPVFKTATRDTDAGILSIAHKQTGNCTVINSDGKVYNLQLQDNVTTTQFNLPIVSELTLGSYTERRAIEVECTTDVLLYMLIRRHTNGGAEAFPVLPVESLSGRYMVPSVVDNALLGVVAVSDNTTVTVQVKSSRNCAYTFQGKAYRRGSQFTVVLQKRVVLQLARPEFNPPIYCDLGGSVVQSSKPVAVFSGSSALPYLPRTDNADGVMSQVPPIETWGTFFYIYPEGDGENSAVRILAAYNDTTVHFGSAFGPKMILLNEREFYEAAYLTVGNIHYINSSKPILVQQIFGEFQKFSVYTSIVPAVATYGFEYLIPDIQTTRMQYERHVRVITSSNCTSSINVDARWTLYSERSYHIASVNFIAPDNMTVIRSNSPACPFAVHVAGFGHNEMFAFYASGTESRDPVPSNSLKLTCTPERWLVTLDTKALASAVDVNKNIYMSNTYCPGVLDGDLLVFNFSYSDCNTKTKTNNALMTFSNYLTEYERDPETDLVTGSKWRYNLECDLHMHETDVINSVPVKSTVSTGQTFGNVEVHEAAVTFYSDSTYKNEIMGNPLKVDPGSNVYVQVAMKDVSDLKLLVDNCYLNDNNVADNSTAVPLIQNRCEANHFTHVIGRVDKLTRFYVDASQLNKHHDNIYVTCDVTFCSLTDFSQICQNGCQMKSG